MRCVAPTVRLVSLAALVFGGGCGSFMAGYRTPSVQSITLGMTTAGVANVAGQPQRREALATPDGPVEVWFYVIAGPRGALVEHPIVFANDHVVASGKQAVDALVNTPPPQQPTAGAPRPAPQVPEAESPSIWHFYNASTGRCEPIARIDLTRALTANNVAGCRDLIPNVERAFVIVCPATAVSGPTVQVFGVSETECEQAQAAAETAGLASGRPAGTSQPRAPARLSF